MSRFQPRRLTLLLFWGAVAALPLLHVAGIAIASSRNIVFWDEFDTALDLVLRIDAGASGRELLQRFFAINNEHRMVTSRLMYAASYWLTGTINFHVIGAIGNLFLVGLGAALVLAVTGWERRLRMAVVFSFLMFQLEHFESFVWSGAAIDHFQVVMHALLAVVMLSRRTIAGCCAAGAFGLLATFTLAHGNVVWPLGALLLAHQRRWREFAGWCAFSVAAVAAFLHGFELNPAHQVVELSAANFLRLARYWLALLGAPLTLGHAAYAPLPGALLLVALGFLARREFATRQPVAFFGTLFAIGALTLIALGRAELAGGEVNSRYLIHGALAWALVLFMLLEFVVAARPAHPFRPLALILPALVVFTIAANRKFAPQIDSFTEVRDRAATSFEQFGEDGKGITRLHPRERHADILLQCAEARGVYRLPEFSRPAHFAQPTPTPGPRMIAHVDELHASERAVTAGGWAMLPGVESKRDQVYLVLRSDKSLLYFSTVTLQRSDIARHYQEPGWLRSGFRAVIRRERLPAEDFEVGLFVKHPKGSEFILTQNRLDLTTPSGAAVKAPPP